MFVQEEFPMNSLLGTRLGPVLLTLTWAVAFDPPARSQTLPPAPDATWNLLLPRDPDTPPSRAGHAAIYDPIRKRMIVYGGADPPNDLWEMKLGEEPAWSRLDVAGTVPPTHSGHSAVYDPVRDRMIVYGGVDDLWALSLAGQPSWEKLAPAGTPPPLRGGQSVIYDPVRDRLVIFGGNAEYPNCCIAETNVVWALTLAGTPTWESLAPATFGPPSARRGQSAIYDPVRDRMIIFGGQAQDLDFFNDSWSFSFGNPGGWEVINAYEPPHWRYNHTAVYDSVGDRMLVFGGTIDRSIEGSYNETWALGLSGNPTWQVVPSGVLPVGRYWHSAICDPDRKSMIVFGGFGYEGLNDCWELSLADSSGWNRLSPHWPPSRPGPQYTWSTMYDASRGRMLLFGGSFSDPTAARELWSLSLSGSRNWSLVPVEGGPPGSWSGYRAAYDSRGDRVIAIGQKWNYSDPLDEVWALSLSEPMSWTRLTPSNPPPGRWGFSLVYDPEVEALVIYGGETYVDELAGRASRDQVLKPRQRGLDDFWALHLVDPPSWQPFLTSGSPVHAAWSFYDPSRHRLVGFSPDSNNVWELSFTAGGWRPLPGPRAAPPWGTVLYDSKRDRFVGLTPTLDASWSLPLADGSPWAPITPTGETPTWREGFQTIYDPVGDRIIIAGGVNQWSGIRFDEVWGLAFGTATATALALAKVDVTPEHVVLSWYGSATAGMSALVERRLDDRDWVEIGRIESDGRGVFVFEDRDVMRGARYFYRLRVGDALTQETSVEIPLELAFALRGPRPNPARTDVLIEFSVPRALPVALALYDVQGRLQSRKELGRVDPGAHTVRFGDARDLSPGVYLLQLSQGDRSLTTRLLVMR